jgi:RNA polymerase sigma-70 factor (ECF subfamily)
LSLDAAPGALREPSPAPSGEGRALQNERLALAHAALETLSDEHREVFVLARVEEMSAPEIAEVIGIPLNTVYSRLRAARLAFDAAIARGPASTRSKT